MEMYEIISRQFPRLQHFTKEPADLDQIEKLPQNCSVCYTKSFFFCLFEQLCTSSLAIIQFTFTSCKKT